MKALSLTQPWATAIAIGIKQWETRSWAANYRGEVAIHASKGWSLADRTFAQIEYEEGRLKEPCGNLPRGCVIAVATLTACRMTEEVVKEIGEVEEIYGDYSDGRYAFKLENVRPLKVPVICKGALGFWSVDADLERRIREQLL